MPELTDEYLDIFLERLRVLNSSDHIILLQCDDNSYVIAEIYQYPERRETDPNNEYEIYPIAKLLTEEEIKELSFYGQTPKLPCTYKVGKESFEQKMKEIKCLKMNFCSTCIEFAEHGDITYCRKGHDWEEHDKRIKFLRKK